jgi:hypothetical protein
VYPARGSGVTTPSAERVQRKGLSSGTYAKAKAAGKAAGNVLVEMKPVAKLEKACADARSARDALTLSWETAFAALKRAARAAEDDGAKGLFGALFERAPKAKKNGKKTAKSADDKPQ